jgi:hypothetical protein
VVGVLQPLAGGIGRRLNNEQHGNWVVVADLGAFCLAFGIRGGVVPSLRFQWVVQQGLGGDTLRGFGRLLAGRHGMIIFLGLGLYIR